MVEVHSMREMAKLIKSQNCREVVFKKGNISFNEDLTEMVKEL